MCVYSKLFYEVFDADGRSLGKQDDRDKALNACPQDGFVEEVDRVVIQASPRRRIVREDRKIVD